MPSSLLPESMQSDRLLLRRPSPADVTALYAIYSDVSVVRWLNWLVYADPDILAQDIARYEQLWSSGQEYFWVIELTETSSVIGSIACGVLNQDADIGFMLNSDFHRQGFATEAVRRLLRELTSSDRIERVVAYTAVENNASVGVLEKAGFERRGVAPAFIVCPNISDQPRDAIVYSIDCPVACP